LNVVYQAQFHGRDQALAYLDEQDAELGYRTEFAARARDWLTLPDPATGSAERDTA
jgi:hypothetical protein